MSNAHRCNQQDSSTNGVEGCSKGAPHYVEGCSADAENYIYKIKVYVGWSKVVAKYESSDTGYTSTLVSTCLRKLQITEKKYRSPYCLNSDPLQYAWLQ